MASRARARPRPLPRAPPARGPARRHAFRGPAADGRDRAGAAQPQPAPARRRADEGPCAAARHRGRLGARACGGADDDRARGAEPVRRPASRARRRRARRRPGRPLQAGGGAARRPRARPSPARRPRRRALSTFALLTITGLGLGAMYFLVASGLSLIYGLMGVLNFAHGALLTVGAYATWWTSTKVDGSAGTKLLVGAVAGLAVGAVLAALIEL